MMKKSQIEILQRRFEENPDWDLEAKMLIAIEISMTQLQVAKWNWDERRRRGMTTRPFKLKRKN